MDSLETICSTSLLHRAKRGTNINRGGANVINTMPFLGEHASEHFASGVTSSMAAQER